MEIIAMYVVSSSILLNVSSNFYEMGFVDDLGI